MDNLVSVCVLTYNQELFIRETLYSIINQTYKNIELIILDDASSDGTRDIIENEMEVLKNRFTSVKFLIHENNTRNIPQNVNELIHEASGDFIKEFSGDDIMFPECVEILVREALEHPDVLVIHTNGYIENENYHYGDEHSWRLFRDAHTESWCENNFINLLYRNNVLSPSTLIKSNVFKMFGDYDTNLLYEDYEMWLRIVSNGGKMLFLDRALIAYRRTQDSITNIIGEYAEDKLLYCIKAEIEVRKKYIDELDIKIRDSIWSYVYDSFKPRALRLNSHKCLQLLDEVVSYSCRDDYGVNRSSVIPTDDRIQAETEILCRWIDNYEKIERIILEWQRKNFAISIFGFSRLGRRLYYLLIEKGVKVSYIIDRQGDAVYAQIPVHKIEDDLEKVDIIVVTAMGAYNTVAPALAQKSGADVVNLMEMIYAYE